MQTKYKQFTLREEYFGYTFYDKQNLRHKFILKNELDKLLGKYQINEKDYDYLPIKEKKYRKDLIYSPTRIYYELTLACNIRCKYCFNNSGKKRQNEMSTEEIIKSLYNLKEANVMDIRFTGGEPICHPGWYEIFKTAKNLGFAVSLNTNGYYSNPEVYDRLASLNIEQITISIDGTKEHHEKNRGTGTFDVTVNTLKELFKRKANLRINVLISRSSMNDIEYMVNLASQYTKEINFFAVRFFGRGKELENEESISFEEFYNMSQKTFCLREKYPNINIMHFEQPLIDNSSRKELKEKFGLVMCAPDGSTRFNITSDGRLWAGGYIPYIDEAMCVGNIKKDKLFNIWQFSKKLEKFRKESGKLIEFCSDCSEFMKKCPGANYEREFYRKKHPGAKNPYCLYGNGPSLLLQMTKNNDKK